MFLRNRRLCGRCYRKKLVELDTYVFVDVSNIRAACLKTCGFQIDFLRLVKYFQKKYPRLREVGYYEGLAKGDEHKIKILRRLSDAGYNVRTLERKAYLKPAVCRGIICKKCGYKNNVVVMPKTQTLKSNVDVYLASEMLGVAYAIRRRIHIVIVSCDGDYAEAIKMALKNKRVRVTVMATPSARDTKKNTLSSRLKKLSGEIPEDKYRIFNIEDIRHEICIKNEDDPESASSRVGNASPVT